MDYNNIRLNYNCNYKNEADANFARICNQILEYGYSSEGQKIRPHWEDGTPANTLKTFGIITRYDLSKEFPEITLRPTPIKTSAKEIMWVYRDKSNNIKDLPSTVWDEWADENGSIGKAYGYQLKQKYKFPFAEEKLDQVDAVLWQLKNQPYSRRIMTNLYNFSDLSEMALEPCAYSLTFNVTGNRLNTILNQRSQDMLAAFAWNEAQYAILSMVFSKVSGLQAGEFIHVISDAHIYDRHIPIIEQMLSRTSKPQAKVYIDDSLTNFYDFDVDKHLHIVRESKDKNEPIKDIPIAI